MFIRTFKESGLPSLAGIFITSPLERYTIISQTRSLLKAPAGYPSFSLYLQQVYTREGFSGYFRGSFSRLAHYLLGSAVTFRLYHYLHSFTSSSDQSNQIEKVITDYLFTITIFSASELFAYNFERSRTLMACDFAHKDNPRTYNGSFEVFSHSLRAGGVLKAYSGFGLYIGSFGFYAINASIFLGALKDLELEDSTGAEMSAFAAARGLSYPLEVLRRRKQVSGTEFYAEDAPQFYKQMSAIFKSEGLKGFYRGVGPAVLQSCACIGIAKMLMGDNRDKSE